MLEIMICILKVIVFLFDLIYEIWKLIHVDLITVNESHFLEKKPGNTVLLKLMKTKDVKIPILDHSIFRLIKYKKFFVRLEN